MHFANPGKVKRILSFHRILLLTLVALVAILLVAGELSSTPAMLWHYRFALLFSLIAIALIEVRAAMGFRLPRTMFLAYHIGSGVGYIIFLVLLSLSRITPITRIGVISCFVLTVVTGSILLRRSYAHEKTLLQI